MLKNILKLKGVQKLSVELQKTVKGGKPNCFDRKTGQCAVFDNEKWCPACYDTV
jgi:hypothetical protein